MSDTTITKEKFESFLADVFKGAKHSEKREAFFGGELLRGWHERYGLDSLLALLNSYDTILTNEDGVKFIESLNIKGHEKKTPESGSEAKE